MSNLSILFNSKKQTRHNRFIHNYNQNSANTQGCITGTQPVDGKFEGDLLQVAEGVLSLINCTG
jgi:hypothetical protein